MDHDAFATSRARVYIRRNQYFDRLDAHAAGTGPPLIVTGESGAGKSALLANWAVEYRERHPQDLLLMHFVGVTPGSGNWAAMVRRILGALDHQLGVKTEIPDDAAALQSAFAESLYRAAARHRVVLVLDALNQLEDREGAPDLVWLPSELPAAVRLLASTLPGRPLDSARKRNWPEVIVQPLEPGDRRKLIQEYLGVFGKNLTNAQLDRLAEAPQSANPLYLRALLEELRVFGYHEKLIALVEHYLAARDARELYGRILSRYEEDYDDDRPGLVRDSMRLIWAARRGLSESELLHLLAEEGKPLPQAVWAPLYLAAEQIFTNLGGLIGFAHSYIREAVADKYLSEEGQIAAHKRLAGWFADQHLSGRKVEELPWQLAAAQEWDGLAAFLTDFDSFVNAWEADQFELKGHWSQIEANSSLRIVNCYRLTRKQVEADPQYATLIALLLRDTGHLNEALAVHAQLAEYSRATDDQAGLQISLHNQAITLQDLGNLDSAMTVLKEAERISRTLNNQDTLQANLIEHALILYVRGDADGAMALLKEVERICGALSDPSLLQACLGNEATILFSHGDLDGAMAACKRQEYLCRVLNDQDGLQISVGEQANILYARGDVDGALKLNKEKERACRVLGNQNGLQVSLGNQALILQHNGDGRGALRLFKEQECICRAIGNQRALHLSLANQGLVLKDLGDLDGAMSALREAEHINRALVDQERLEIILFAQAEICLSRGDLESGLALAQEQERICRAIGNQEGLHRSLGCQALVLTRFGDVEGAMARLKEAEGICREIGDLDYLARILALQSLSASLEEPSSEALTLAEEAHTLPTNLGDTTLAAKIQRAVEFARRRGED